MKANNIDFSESITIFKNIKNKVEIFSNKIYSECIENYLRNNNKVKAKFEEIKNLFLLELQTNIEELEKIKNAILNNNKNPNQNKNNQEEKSKQNELIKNKNNDIQKSKLFEQENKLKQIENLKTEIKENLSNTNKKIEFNPPQIYQNILSFSNELNEGVMEENSSNLSEEDNFEFLRFDNEVFINELKGQTIYDKEDIILIEEMKPKTGNLNIRNEYQRRNFNKEENEDNNMIQRLTSYNNEINNNNSNYSESYSFHNFERITTSYQENKIEDRWPFKIQNLYTLYIIGTYKKELANAILNLDWKERNLIEFLFLRENSTFLYSYNVLLSKRDKIETEFRTPLNFSYLNLPPYVFLSGGLNLKFKELSSIIRIRKIENEVISYEKYAQLIIPRSSHSSVYISFSNSIIFISGSKTNSCEELNIKTKLIKKICDLNTLRENSSPCVFNDTDLYVFFGYNSQSDKFITSIEKLNLKTKLKWELINIKINDSDKSLCLRKNLSCVPYKLNYKDGILLVGGIGNNNMECREICFYFISSKSLTPIKNKLPSLASFTHQLFVEYGVEDSDLLFNVSNSGLLLQFSKKSGEFIPII